MPKKDGSPTENEMKAGYKVGNCMIGKRSHNWFWNCLICGDGAGREAHGLAYHDAITHRCA